MTDLPVLPVPTPNIASGAMFDPAKTVTTFPTTFPISDIEHGRLQSRLDHLREKSRVALTSQALHALTDGEIREAIEIIACLRRTHTGAAKAKAKGKKAAPSLDELLA